MRKLSLYLSFIFLAVLTFSCTEPIVSTFGSIGGTVQDGQTGDYLSGVTVLINPLGYSQVTNADGAFQYDNLEVSEYTLVYSKEGYETYKHKVTVKPGVVSSVQVTMKSASATITTSPAVLDFGAKESELQLRVSSPSGASVSYRMSVSNDWMSLSKYSGTVSKDDYVTVLVSREGLSPATYDGNVAINVEGNVISVPVKMIVEAAGVPSVTMEKISEVASSSAMASGTIKYIGDSKVSSHGFCWSSENASPDVNDETVELGDASDVKSFSAKITGLKPATQYYIRAYAINSSGIAYSTKVESFTTDFSSESGDDSDNDEIVVPQGLMSYYTFNAGDASDITENELDGMLINDPSFTDETIDGTGQALSLNGVKKQYMSIPYNVFSGLTKYSISFWIKDFNQGMIMSAVSNQLRSDNPRLIALDDGFFRFYVGYDNYDNTPAFVYQYTPIQSSGWHQIAVTTNDGLRVLYIDGKRVDANETYLYSQSHCTKIYIGGDKDGAYVSGISMKIDNIRFYQRTLSDSEITTIYDSEM